MISQTRIGRYEVVAVLGAGAAGTVYKAVDPLTRRTVAIRTIKLDRSKPERAAFEARVCREAESAVRLRHANIAAIYEVGETDDIAYVAMEYVEGASLREMLDSGAVLPIEMIASIAERIANALDYAHENQVVHRDIRPANIMITPSREVKIVNFGVAQFSAGSHPQLGTLLETPGSPRHMAPEQVAGGNTDGRTDIFALGVVLYEMLTGVVPFDGDELGVIIDKVLTAEPVPPSALNTRVPGAFDHIITRALAKRPRDRYQSGLEFARDLRNPDAAPAGKARRPVAVAMPEKAVQAGRTPVAVPGTGLLSPRTVQAGIAVPSVADRNGVTKKTAFVLGTARLRKSILLALPVGAIAAFVMVSQGQQARRGELAAVVATPAVPATPAASAEPAVSSEPEGQAEPASQAEPEGQVAPAVPAVPRVVPKPKVAAKPTLSARPAAPANAPGVPESASLPAPVSVTQANATLMLAVSPWGEVYVDGNRVGVTPPLATLELEPGTHDVEIRNQAFVPYRETVNLEPGRSFKIRHKFK